MTNTLNAIEKAAKKVQNVINEYNKLAGNAARTVDVNKTKYNKCILIMSKLEKMHSEIIESNWNNNVFFA